MPKKRRAKKKGKDVSPHPEDYRVRVSSPWKVGAHVSAAGGVENAIQNAASIGANAFALFLKSQRKWTAPPAKEESILSFPTRSKLFGYTPANVLPHGSYLINLGNPDADKRNKSYECFLDELQRCEQLGLQLYNFHPGSTVGNATQEESLALVAECINRAHEETESVVVVLENTAGAGNVLGSRFSELATIIQQVHDKSRIGVCLDTCHMFAAGYDIRTPDDWNATMTSFEQEIGIQYLKGMHLNDSKAPLGSKKDRHENIGQGHLGLASFLNILTDSRTQGIPLVLETPNYDDDTGVWAAEVDILNRLSTLSLGPRHLGTSPEVECQLKEWTEEVHAAVKKASVAKVAKQVKSATHRRLKSRKGPQGDAGQDEDGKEQESRAMEREQGGLSDLSELSDLTVEEEAQLVDENRTL
ncbi:AP endonuclease [Punctularia strigosozonata HHB-11173 SS5]|uniref:AP endonuclease n=1 Tax=Punctularia strigosozonata (strain HHB-11173) TaxID=741275 RepID=UPI0004418290|nr:AP endonuclease [Punctularia strigosozonata HHB-11173 SS5]EIN06965.1 AP endonuclease [Punctularia strigosozonata HHB-11173 SS5]